MSVEEEKGLLARADEFLQAFKKGAEFTQELLRENERLRFRTLQLEADQKGEGVAAALAVENRKLAARVEELEREIAEIIGQIRQIEAENNDFAARYVEIEEENNNLANLYIASYQLHSTLDFSEVLQIITEIIINLIGAEEFAVMLVDEKTGSLDAVAAEGISLEELPRVRLGEGVIGIAAGTGENYFAEGPETYERDLLRPMVCIPLKIKEHVIGVIAIYKLLIQKKSFASVDYELFTLLAGHAATAIFSSRIYSDSERKLSTMQGFINLLTT
ncbi:GAF domain-containing protein [Geobacter sulfurreducens]|jgi:nitrate/nitrite-specific signal transduction histidine kinase|uniref:GAF domain protein n=1 Tax=Geobacter sulfurreducens (strain ATCC 51573 / DSM 12127 / PCA) TaxID=243231 RepID=Q74AY6_GEOSL|nr:GAF domain-containing protein [Geobacter sulfurreducens]AAR35589.1 GAF domain protein [Geobacter sulfurreducens PCA]ADI84971.1 GAF domain protein [Geobacter sulfurreducens KN400]AJY68451.1 diguanylate phosphodiesterase [Geobacter sulfurreducens]QVW34071.1 GAF domain-containing protein [Geobacter sulfurreducens]UAC02930.1 GAF domain-containing protein [Geobacter sulfurreducens]